MKILTVGNRKGGTGKTTTTYNLAFSLALQKNKVCLIDLDSQANLSLLCKVSPIGLDAFKKAELTPINNFISILPATKKFNL